MLINLYNSAMDEKWTHSLQNLEIYCTFIGWSLLPPTPAPPPKKKTYQIRPENLWQAKTGRGLRTPHEEATLGTIPPLPSLLLVAVNPKLSAKLVGSRISGYMKWSEFAVSAWRGWRYWLYDDDFPRTYKASCIFWLGGCMYFIQGVGYLKLTRIKNVKGLRVQRQTVWNS